jgi:hypothetical protein
VVLPTLAQCTTTPTTAGCSVVLPTLAQCTAIPTTAGCTLVLPAAIAATTPVAQIQAAVITTLPARPTVNLITGNTGNTGTAGTFTANSDDKTADQKSDGGSGSGTNGNTATKPGITNDAAKKMYCN